MMLKTSHAPLVYTWWLFKSLDKLTILVLDMLDNIRYVGVKKKESIMPIGAVAFISFASTLRVVSAIFFSCWQSTGCVKSSLGISIVYNFFTLPCMD